MPLLRIYLFGVPRFERNGEAIHIPRQKAIALLSYLGMTGQMHSRDHLATMFWPEHDQSGARANLRRELSRIKSALGYDPFDLHGEQVSLKQGDLWLDVKAFQAELAKARERSPEQPIPAQRGHVQDAVREMNLAVAFYTADFMAGFSLPDSPQFDDWQYFQSESLRRSLGETLQGLAGLKIALGELELAIEDARRWLALDHLSEPAHRQLMQLYAWSGQHGAALRQYLECVRLLEKELGVSPEDETTGLYEAIRARRLPQPESLLIRPATSDEIPVAGGAGSTAPVRSSVEGAMLLRSQPGNLPAPSTSFIGRQKEQAQAEKLLVEDPHCRLLTVTGPGGAGKTRLALQVALASQSAFSDGAYFVPLASLTTADHILPRLAEQLRFSFHEAADHKQQLFDYLRHKKILLVLDNFEHLLPGADLILEILQISSGIKVMVTSRERLNLSNEVVLALGGMQYPAWTNGGHIPADLQEYEAVKLFLESARRVQPDFELHPQDVEPVARLCRLVEGMPLGIILAAGWLEMLSPQEISEEISRSLDFLESSAKDLPERQRSLRAVFNSSWSLLTGQEQEALACLTVFKGSFTNPAALAVSGAPHKTLLALLQKAWLLRSQDGRLQIHELQRQYAFEILAAQPMLYQRAQDAHSTFYAERLVQLSEGMRGHGTVEAYDEVTAEFENIRAAWHWLVERKKFGELVYHLLPAIYRYCEVRAKSSELLELVGSALQAMEDKADVAALSVLLTVQASFYQKGDPVRLDRYDVLLPPAYKANIDRVGSLIHDFEDLAGMGLWGILFAYLYGRFVDYQKGVQYLHQLIEHFRVRDQRWELAYAHEMLGCLYLVLAMYSTQKEPYLDNAGRNLSDALELLQQLGDEREQGYTLLWLGDYHYRSGRLEEAKSCWQSAQAVFETGGDLISSMHWMVGTLLFTTGDYEAAFIYYRGIREQYLERGHKRFAAYSLSYESIEALRYSNLQHARQTRLQSLELSREVQDAFGEAWSTWEMGEILRVEGDISAARSWFDRARSMFEDVKEANGIIFYHRGLGDLALAQGDAQEAHRQFQLSLQLARQAEYSWGITYALAGLGCAAIEQGQHDLAQAHLREALQSALATEDQGLALVVLAVWAKWSAVTGKMEAAAEICTVVAGHYAAWNETKAQVKNILARFQTSIQSLAQPETTMTEEQRQSGDLWEFVHRLLAADEQS